MRFRFRLHEFSAATPAELFLALADAVAVDPLVWPSYANLAIWIPSSYSHGRWCGISDGPAYWAVGEEHLPRSFEDMDAECARWFACARRVYNGYASGPDRELFGRGTRFDSALTARS